MSILRLHTLKFKTIVYFLHNLTLSLPRRSRTHINNVKKVSPNRQAPYRPRQRRTQSAAGRNDTTPVSPTWHPSTPCSDNFPFSPHVPWH